MMILALLAAAVAPVPVAAVDYHASGTEPFWSLTIARGRMRLEQAGMDARTVRAPAARRTAAGRRYVGRGMTVAMTRTRCSDGMSDRTYPETVTVTVGRRVLRGCGGLPVADMVESTSVEGRWTVVATGGPAPDVAMTVTFAGNRIEGRICNTFSGAYRMTGNRLVVGALRATRMACFGAPDDTERRFFDVVAEPATVAMNGRDRIVLTNARGSVTLTRDR